MQKELWTPQGTVPLGSSPVGYNAETGSQITRHTLLVKAKDDFGKEHATRIIVLADGDTSKAHIEEMMGKAAESFKDQVREKYSKRPPTAQEKKEIGKALNEVRKHMRKRNESTTGKLYF